MKESVMLKKKKLMTNTYMRDVTKYQTIIINESDDYFITVKRFDTILSPFILHDVTYIENGSYMVEITPLNENYNIRKYISKDKKEFATYIDISMENGVQDRIPYYIDLYLDVVVNNAGEVNYLDEDELEDALKDEKISKEDYDLAYTVANKLKKEINEKTNIYMNMDVVKMVNRYFE